MRQRLGLRSPSRQRGLALLLAPVGVSVLPSVAVAESSAGSAFADHTHTTYDNTPDFRTALRAKLTSQGTTGLDMINAAKLE